MSSAISPLRFQVTPNLETGGQTESIASAGPQKELLGLGNQSQPTSESFADLLSGFVSGVNEQHHASSNAQAALMRGEDIEIHDVMIQMEQASLSTDLLLEMRNRLVATVNELTRMPI